MIVCCGEALIDMIPSETADGRACMVPTPGGAVFNTAIALGRLGADVGLFTGISDDLFGQMLQGALTASDVSCAHLKTMDAPSSLAFVSLTNGQAKYTFYTQGAADTQLQPHDVPAGLAGAKALFFGGISLCTDPTASTLEAVMVQASGAGTVTMIDPNIRPAFIKDEAAYRARLGRMMAVADIVKLSDEDLAWVAGDNGDMAAQAQALGLQDHALLLVTLGADGACIYRAGQVLCRVAGQPAKVVDTIGAGDTFNAGVLAALHDGGLLSRAGLAGLTGPDLAPHIAFANACAAHTVSKPGADPPWRRDLAGL